MLTLAPLYPMGYHITQQGAADGGVLDQFSAKLMAERET